MKNSTAKKVSRPAKMTPEQFAQKHQQYFSPLPNAMVAGGGQFPIFTTEDFSVRFYSSDGSVAAAPIDARAEHA